MATESGESITVTAVNVPPDNAAQSEAVSGVKRLFWKNGFVALSERFSDSPLYCASALAARPEAGSP
jgi:hypothetical protein